MNKYLLYLFSYIFNRLSNDTITWLVDKRHRYKHSQRDVDALTYLLPTMYGKYTIALDDNSTLIVYYNPDVRHWRNDKGAIVGHRLTIFNNGVINTIRSWQQL